MDITSSGEWPGQDAGIGEIAMKKIALSIVAVAVIVGSVATYRAAAKPGIALVQVEEVCKGLGCWPTVPVPQPRSVRLGLPPVW